jgi:dimethylaniline monooxygenase (N-oxide forming)
MWAEIYERREKIAKRYVASQRHTIQVDFIPYMDELATEIGCKPDLGEMIYCDE